MRKLNMACRIALSVSLALVSTTLAQAQQSSAQQPPAQQQEAEKPKYTLREYNQFKAATDEKVAAQRVKLLDAFVAEFPESTLMPFVLQSYLNTYVELSQPAKIIEAADKLLALGEKIEVGSRFQAIYLRSLAYHQLQPTPKTPGVAELSTKARDAALEGLKLLEQLPKPEQITEEQFAAQKKQTAGVLMFTAGAASALLNDHRAAAEQYKAAVANNPDALTYYRMGVSYLQIEPPEYMDGFWALARAISMKIQGEAQVRAYMKSQVIRMQGGTVCEPETDKQIAELLALAASSPERPLTYKLPVAAEIDQVRTDKGATFIEELKAGGDRAKMMWLAVCGLEYPDVAVKVISVEPGNASVVLSVYRAAALDPQVATEEMEKATQANMQVKVEGQPDAIRVEKDTFVRFSGTLARFTPEPFTIFWEKATVNAEDIPESKAAPAKKAPAKKAPAKRPPPKKTP